MFKRFFQISFHEDEAHMNGTRLNGTADHAAERENHEAGPALEVSFAPPEEAGERTADAKSVSFEDIYRDAHMKPPKMSYGILKVAEMVNSTHLVGMPPEAKRCSLMMALDAAGIQIEDLLQDAMLRQRALNDYEEGEQKRLDEFQASKVQENTRIQTELDRLTAQYMARIQTNLDEVAREEDNFRAWQKRKQQESQRIAEAAAFCVPHGPSTTTGSLTMVLERATTQRR
jgi:hypothetical protein